MFGKKKLPVLTDSFCVQINLILKIAGVLTGINARMKRFDFNTGRGQLYLGEEIQEFYFDIVDSKRYHFAPMTVGNPRDIYEWNFVHLEEGGEVRIGAMYEKNAHTRSDGMPLWWVGDSAANRREKPYWP